MSDWELKFVLDALRRHVETTRACMGTTPSTGVIEHAILYDAWLTAMQEWHRLLSPAMIEGMIVELLAYRQKDREATT